MIEEGITNDRESPGVSYILDEQFGRLYHDHRNLFPQWWREGLQYLARLDVLGDEQWRA